MSKGYELVRAAMNVAEFKSLSVVRTLNRRRTLPNRAKDLAYYH
jgi:hypothetical protein